MEITPENREVVREVRRKRRARRLYVTAALTAVLLFFANGVIYGTWRPDHEFLTSPLWHETSSSFVPWLCTRLGISQLLKPNLSHLDVSTKPPSWNGKDEELDSIKGANLSYRNISFANCNETFAANTRFVGANVSGTQFGYGDLRKSDFSRALGKQASFAHARLTKAIFGASKMIEAHFYGAQLDGTIFTSDFLRARLDEDNKSRSLLVFSTADFSGTDFTFARMNECDCRSTIFTKSRFLVARLRGVDFTGSDLRMVYFTGASITDCDFELTKLSGSSFDAAILTSVKFDDADFSDRNNKLGTVFSNAILRGVDFSNAHAISSAVFSGAHFDKSTKWPANFDPIQAGAVADPGEPPATTTQPATGDKPQEPQLTKPRSKKHSG
jgi:uncharacterized protein YjbI with pentapeptide repeats